MISVSSLSLFKLCISSVVMIFVYNVQMQSYLVVSFTFIRSRFKSLLLSASEMVLRAYLQLLLFILPVFTPSSESSLVFHICSMYRLSKWGSPMHPCLTHYPVENHCLHVQDTGYTSGQANTEAHPFLSE